MNEITAYREQIDGLDTMLTAQIAEVPDAILYRRTGPSQNPIGFIYWHILRIWDLDHSLRTGTNPLTDDLWHRHDFAAKADYSPDGLGLRGLGMGIGYTDAQVDGVRIPRELLWLKIVELSGDWAKLVQPEPEPQPIDIKRGRRRA